MSTEEVNKTALRDLLGVLDVLRVLWLSFVRLDVRGLRRRGSVAQGVVSLLRVSKNRSLAVASASSTASLVGVALIVDALHRAPGRQRSAGVH